MSEPVGPKPSACPILEDKIALERAARDWAKALRNIRKHAAACKSCVAEGKCPVWQSIDATIQAAIQIVNDEWAVAQAEKE